MSRRSLVPLQQEHFGFKAACAVTSAERAEGDDDDEFLERVLRAAVHAKPRGLQLADDVYIAQVGMVPGLLCDRMLFLLPCSWPKTVWVVSG